MQLDLLAYQPTPQEMQAPDVPKPIAPAPKPHAIAWHEAKAAYYLRLINRFVGGCRCSAEVKRSETSRLFAMRSAALEELRRLRDAP